MAAVVSRSCLRSYCAILRICRSAIVYQTAIGTSARMTDAQPQPHFSMALFVESLSSSRPPSTLYRQLPSGQQPPAAIMLRSLRKVFPSADGNAEKVHAAVQTASNHCILHWWLAPRPLTQPGCT